MASTGSRRGAANVSLILAVIAFVAMGGLIYWLNITAEPTQTQFVPEDTAAEEEPVSDVPLVELEQLRAELEEYVGLEIEMRRLTVSSTLGDYGIWVGPQDNPFLVMQDSSFAAGDVQVSNGDSITARGTIHEMSDSVLNAWEERGAIAGAGERAVASFAEIFMEANSIREPGGGGSQGAAQDTAASDADGGDAAGGR